MATDKTPETSSEEVKRMMKNAQRATDFLKALANENRLLFLCLLAEGEKSVTELESSLNLRQPTVSQQLGRLRAENLVKTRRDGKVIYYSLASEEARQVIELVYALFCGPAGKKAKGVEGYFSTAAE